MSNPNILDGFIATKNDMTHKLADANGRDYLSILDNDNCLIQYWTPKSPDSQPPHDRDEVYIIIAGKADFEMNNEVRATGASDLIFVPAGIPHRFVKCSSDLAMWIVFFGPHHEEFKKWRGKEY